MSLKWKQNIDALETRLKTILTTGGYYTNAGNYVYVWRSTTFEVAEMPGLNIRDLNDAVREEFTGNPNLFVVHELNVEIDIITSSAVSLRQAIADVLKAINTDRTLGELADDIEYNSAAILTDEQNENIVKGGRISINIIYRTDKFEED
jgi:hypothetical protein